MFAQFRPPFPGWFGSRLSHACSYVLQTDSVPVLCARFALFAPITSSTCSFLTPTRSYLYTAPMRSTYDAPRVRFDWRGFITPGVKLLVLFCTGVFFLQTIFVLLFSPSSSLFTLSFV